MNGAVLAPNWLGDAVMSLPALRALCAATPGETWTVLARPHVAPVYALARLPLQVELLPPPRQFLRSIPAHGARQVVILPNSFHAALLALRMGARRRIGYARDRRGWLLHPAIAPPLPGALPGHESFRYLELLRQAGLIAALPPEAPAQLRVPLHPESARVARWRELLCPGAPTQPIAALHVGATNSQAKCWPPERFAELAGALSQRGAAVVLIGGQAERELARRVRMAAPRPEQVKNLAGETSLDGLVALLAAADLLVANDSGPMHVAGAVGTPVVALFGPTNDKETYPLTEDGKLRLIKAGGIECSPCMLRTCPIDHRCMQRIPVAQVVAEAEALLFSGKKVLQS